MANSITGMVVALEMSAEHLQNLLERADILEYIAARYSGTFEAARRIALCLKPYSRHCVLFDFDVIDTLISEKTEYASDVLAIQEFLDKGSLPFALPFGALLELLDFLSGPKQTEILTRELLDEENGLLNTLESRDVLIMIARAIGIKKSQLLAIDALEERIENHFRMKGRTLGRLSTFLTHERFTGIRRFYKEDERSAWNRLLVRHPRKHQAKSAKKNIYRDSLNLSIAARGFIDRLKIIPAGPEDEGILLVTRTQSMTNLLDWEYSDNDLNSDLFRSLRYSLFANRDLYPVTLPAYLTTFELLGGGRTKGALARTALRAEECANLFSAMQSQIKATRASGMSASTDNIEKQLRDNRRLEFRRLVRDAAGNISQMKSHFDMRDVTDYFATSDSVAIMYGSDVGDSSDTETRSLALRFGALLESLTEDASKHVELKFEPAHSTKDADSYASCYNLRRKQDSDGAILAKAWITTESVSAARYIISWPTVVTDVHFIGILARLLKPISKHIDMRIKPNGLLKCAADDLLDRPGFYYESLGSEREVFYYPVGSRVHWEDLLLGSVMRMVGGYGGPSVKVVRRIQCVTNWGRIYFDVAPSIGAYRRYIGVHASNSEHFCKMACAMYDATSSRIASTSELSKVLLELTSGKLPQ